MKIHLIKRETIEKFMIKQARSRPSFEEWLEKIRAADWQIPEDIKRTFNSADLLGDGCNRVVFNIAEYTALCKDNLQYLVDDY